MARDRDVVPGGLDWQSLPLPMYKRHQAHSCQLADLEVWAAEARVAAAATRDSFAADNGPSSDDLQVAWLLGRCLSDRTV